MNFMVQVIALKTLVVKEVGRIFRIWTQTLLPPLINQTLYFLIFGGFVGSQIAPIDGVGYMAFIVPGLIIMSVVNNAFTNSAFSFFMIKFQKSVEELLVSPVKSWVVVLGYTVASIIRSLVVAGLIFLVSVWFVSYSLHSVLFILLFVLLTGGVFALIGLLNGIFANKFDDVSLIPTFVLTPLTYLGGVFYSVDRLPETFQLISKFNPVVYMVEGARFGFFGKASVDVYLSLLVLAVLNVGLFLVCSELLKRGVRLKS